MVSPLPKPKRRVQCRSCPLRSMAAFQAVTAEEIAFIENFKTGEFQVEAGTSLFVEQSSSTHLYTVLDGWAFRYKELEDGRRQILNYVLPGDFIGLQAAVFGEMQHSIDALTNMTMCVFERQRFFEIYRGHSQLAFDVTWLASREERIIDEHLLSVGRRSALERIGYILLHLHDRMDRLGKADKGRFPLPITQQHLADTLGLSLVHTNKTLKKLTARKLMEWRDGTVLLPNRKKLAELVYYDGANNLPVRPLI